MARSWFLALFMVLLVALLARAAPAPAPWAVATMWTPILNTPDFRSVYGGPSGRRVKTDRVGLVRELETVAFPGTVFTLHESLRIGSGPLVYRVTTDEYPFPTRTGYFIDARCVTPSITRPPERERALPTRSRIRFRLLSSLDRLYVWGGNCKDGIARMLEWYPATARLDDPAWKMWTVRGVDCSGLLYEAAGGTTPRNASALVRFGRPVPEVGVGRSARRRRRYRSTTAT